MADANIAPEWRACKRFPRFEVSDAGQVRRMADGHVLARSPNGIGYLYVSIGKDGLRHKPAVHHLVTEAFHGDRPAGHEVNHIDGCRGNNTASNLEWTTRAENMSRAKMVAKPGRRAASGYNLTDRDVLEIRRLWRAGGVQQKQLAAKFRQTQGTISHVVTGRVWRHLPMDGQEAMPAA